MLIQTESASPDNSEKTLRNIHINIAQGKSELTMARRSVTILKNRAMS